MDVEEGEEESFSEPLSPMTLVGASHLGIFIKIEDMGQSTFEEASSVEGFVDEPVQFNQLKIRVTVLHKRLTLSPFWKVKKKISKFLMLVLRKGQHLKVQEKIS